jgi:uncharacterized protein (TIGR01244 family)
MLFFVAVFSGGALAEVTFVSVDTLRENGDAFAGPDTVATGQPDQEVLQIAAAAGVVAVIDLRTDGEDRGLDEPSEVAALGMDYLSLPIGRSDITFESAAALDELLASIDGPVLLHCGSSNRVGALIALNESLQGASNEDALAAGRAAGLTRLEPAVQEVLETK